MDEKNRTSRFLRDEKGAATVEFTVLVPWFVFLLVLFADGAVLYLTHTEMYNVARDAARRMSTCQFKSEDDVLAYARQHLNLGMRTYTVAPTFGAQNQVRVEIPVGQAAIFGLWFKPVIGRSLVATATVQAEPKIVEQECPH